MTAGIPGLPDWALPDAPLPKPPSGIVDPPLTQGQPDGSCVVYPMAAASLWGAGYDVPGGWDDASQINQACLQYHTVRLWAPPVGAAPAPFQTQTTIAPPWPVSLKGAPWQTVINYTGNAAAVFFQDTYNPQSGTIGQKHQIAPACTGLVIDGSNAGAAATGLDIQEMSGGLLLGVQSRNFAGANGVGARIACNNYATNSIMGRLVTSNCMTGIRFDALSSVTALERINAEMLVEMQGAGQTGFRLANSVGLFESRLNWHILAENNSVCAVQFDAGCLLTGCDLLWFGEFAPGQSGGTCISVHFTSAAAGTGLKNCRGSVFFEPAYGDSDITTQLFELNGDIIGTPPDQALVNAQTAPQLSGYGNTKLGASPQPAVSGTAVRNTTGVACIAVITPGGTISAITTQDQDQVTTYTWPASYPAPFVPVQGYITLTWTGGAPTIEWVPLGG